MRRYAQVRLLTRVGVGLGLAAMIVLLSTLSVAATEGLVDLAISGHTPRHVDVDSTYVVNVSYANIGSVPSPDNSVQVTLPEGTQFVGATYCHGDPHPPDTVNGRVLTWKLGELPVDSIWRHILIELKPDEDLAVGTALNTEAKIVGSEDESNLENNTVTLTSTVHEMGGSMKRVRTRQAMPAGVLEYTITVGVRMRGEGSKQWVTLIDTLPSREHVRFLGWEGAPQGTLIEGHKLRWQGWVDPDAPVQLRYRLGVEGDVPVGTALLNEATVEWHGRQLQLGPVTTVVDVPYGVMGVGPGEGGQVSHRYGMALNVPPGAVRESTRFQLGPLNTETQPITPPAGWQYAHRAFEVNAFRFGESVQQFDAPLTITLRYSDTDVVGLKRDTLRLWTREGPDGPWKMMDEPVHTMAGTLSHSTTHLSEFALFGKPETQYRHSLYLSFIVR